MKMAEYKWATTIEGTIRIIDTLQREPPSLNNNLHIIQYKISGDETEIELHKPAVFHGDSDGPKSFDQGSLFGKYSRKGLYILRSYNQYRHIDTEITGRELRDNMHLLIKQIKDCWAAGDYYANVDMSRNFWANGDLQLIWAIVEKESLPEPVREMLADLAGVE